MSLKEGLFSLLFPTMENPAMSLNKNPKVVSSDSEGSVSGTTPHARFEFIRKPDVDILPAVLSADRKVAISKDVAAIVVEYVVRVVRASKFLQLTYRNYVTNMRAFFNTRRGSWYRSAFVLSASRLGVLDVPASVLLATDFMNESEMEKLFVPMFAQSAVQAALEDTSFQYFAYGKVRPETFLLFIRKIRFLEGYLPTLFQEGDIPLLPRSILFPIVVGGRALAQILKSALAKSISDRNLFASECQSAYDTSKIHTALGLIERTGFVNLDFTFPVRESGSMASLPSLALAFKNQGLYDYLPGVGLASKTEETLDSIRKTTDKVGDVVDGISEAVPKFSEAAEEITNTLPEIKGASHEAKTLFARLSDMLQPVVDVMSKFKDSTAAAASCFKHLWQFMYKYQRVAFPIVSLMIVVSVRYFVGPALATLITMVLGFIAVVLYGSELAELFRAKISALFGLNAQRNDVPMFVDQVQNDTIVLLSTMYCAAGIDINKKADVISALKVIPSMSKGAEVVYEALVSFFIKIGGWVSHYVGVEPEFASWLDSKFGDWHKKTLNYMADQKSTTLESTELGASTLEQHIAVGLELALEFEMAGKRVLSQLISANVRSLQTIHAELTATIRTGPKHRAEPVSILFIGPPGHGKSACALLLADILTRKEFAGNEVMLDAYKKDPKRFIHQRGVEKWFESYSPDTVVMVRDEFPATKEIDPDTSPLVSLLDEIGVNAKFVPMANADQKGKISYNHAYSILTSNMQSFNSQMLQCPMALARRFHFVIYLESAGKSTNAQVGGELDPNRWKFTLMDLKKDASGQSTSVTYERLSATLNLKEIVLMASGERDRRRKVLSLNTVARESIATSISDSIDERVFTMISTKFSQDNGRLPTNSEFLKELEDPETIQFLELMEVKQSTIDLVRRRVSTSKGKKPLAKFVNQAGSDSSDATTRTLMAQGLITPSEMVARGFPVLNTMDDLIKMAYDPNPIQAKKALIDCVAGSLESILFRLEKIETERSDTMFELGPFKYSFTSSGDDFCARLAAQITSGFVTSTPDGMLYHRVVYTVGLLATMGKMRVLGYEVPWIETYSSTETDSNVFPMLRGDESTGVHFTQTEHGMTTYLPRMLSQFLKIIGIRDVFEFRAVDFADIYYSDVTVIAPRMMHLYHRIKEFGDHAVIKMKDWYAGRITAREACSDCYHFLYRTIKSDLKETYEQLCDAVSVYTDQLKIAIDSAIAWLKENWKTMVVAIGIVGTAMAFLRTSSTVDEDQGLFEEFDNQDSSEHHSKYVRSTAAQRKQRVTVVIDGQSRSANQASVHYIENFAPVLQGNYWHQMSQSGKRLGAWLFIEKQRAIAPAHFITASNAAYSGSGPYIILTRGDKTIEFSKEQVKIVADFSESDRDLIIVDFLNPQLPYQRNIKSYFADMKDEIATASKGVFMVDLFTPKRVATDRAVMEEQLHVTPDSEGHLGIDLLTDGVRKANVIAYPIPTVAGECGSAVVFRGKIVGIHAQGNGNWGLASRVNLLMLEGAYVHPDDETVEPHTAFEPFEYDTRGLVESQLYDESVHKGSIVGVLQPPMNTFVAPQLRQWNSKDSLKPTIFPVNASVQNYPAARGKFGRTSTSVDEEVRRLCIESYKRWLLSFKRPDTFARNLDAIEAVAGVPGTSIKSLDNTTSPGWPYNYLKIDRARIYKIDEKGNFVPGDLWHDLLKQTQFQIRMMCNGFLPLNIFTDTLKYELRPEAKVNRPRMIAGAPFVHTFNSRIHFGAFMAFMADNYRFNDVMIGMDPHQDWDWYHRRMEAISEGERKCFGDFSGFDNNRTPEMMEFVAEIANAFYGDKDDSPIGMVRHALIRNSIIAGHVYHKTIEVVEAGWCSGALLTGLGNSMFNTWLHIYCAVKATKDAGGDYKFVANNYFENVFLKVMGDDCGMGVTESFKFHNNTSMSAVLKRDLGLTYTSVKKSVDVVPFDSTEDCSLLKRDSVYIKEDGRFYGALQIEVILNMICYTKIGDEINVMVQRVDNAIKELSFHPKEVWDKYLPIILRKAGPFYVWKSYGWYELRHLVLDDWNNQISSSQSGSTRDLIDNTSVPTPLALGSSGISEPCGSITLSGVLENNNAMNTTENSDRSLCAGTDGSSSSLVFATNMRRTLTRVGDLSINKMGGFVDQMDTPGNNQVTPAVADGVSILRPTTDSSQNPTTHFADDSIGYESSPVAKMGKQPSFVYELTASNSQTIVDYLKRPSVMTTGNFAASDLGILWSADLNQVFSTLKISRMVNVYTFRSDFQITLQVNADRFQAGRYILFYLPYGGMNSPTDTSQLPNWRKMHTCNLTKITQLPHVEIDLATQTHASLRVPFTSVLPMFSWSTVNSLMQQSNGIVGIIPYSPLDPGTGGSSVCGFTVLGSLDNIAIGSASYAQMDVSTTESKSEGVGPVTKVLGKVGETAEILGELPVLGSLAKETAWFSKVLARAASVWGLSKPLALSAPARMVRNVGPFNLVSDVAHYSKPMGVFSENAVARPPNVPSNVDEMSIDFLKKVPAYFASFTWNTSQAAGTLLWSYGVSPTAATTWSKGSVHSPASLLNLFFFRWRGSMEYIFKLVKTQFHRGRLLISFFPGPTNGVSFAGSEMVYREILDVSTTGAFRVCCPYLVPAPWALQGSNSGYISVHVLDQLVAPTTVTSNVHVLIESCGGDDLQFSLPTNSIYEPYAPSTAQMAESYVETPCFTLGPKVVKPNDDLSMYTSGEPVKSIRSLLKRNWMFNSLNLVLGGGNYAQIYPYALYPVTQAAGTTGALQRDVTASDPINLWSFGYVFSYGSIRYVIRPPSNGTSPYMVESTAIPGGSTKASVYTSTTGYGTQGYKLLTSMSIEGLLELQVPNWNGTLARAVPSHIVNTTATIYMSEPNANCTNLYLGDGLYPTTYQVGVCRSAADDFGLGFFIGVPPVVTTSAT